jgi:hypothetical protein
VQLVVDAAREMLHLVPLVVELGHVVAAAEVAKRALPFLARSRLIAHFAPSPSLIAELEVRLRVAEATRHKEKVVIELQVVCRWQPSRFASTWYGWGWLSDETRSTAMAYLLDAQSSGISRRGLGGSGDSC